MTTYYVRQSGGSDGNAGTSFGAAWATIQYAADTAVAGDLVLICADADYAPTTTIDVDTNNGSATSPIIFRGCASDGTDDGTQATIDGSGITSDNIINEANGVDYIHFENLIFKDATSNGVNQSATQATYNWLFKNCKFQGSSADGINFIGDDFKFYSCEFDNNGVHGAHSNAFASRATFVNCSFHDNTNEGSYTANASSKHVGCKFYDNGGDGLNFDGRAIYNVVVNCTFHGNGGDGIDESKLSGGSGVNVVILNNVFSENGGYGINSVGGTETTRGLVDYNHFYSNTSGATTDTQSNISGYSGTADPQFTSVTDGSEDFTPISSSPLIDAGLNGHTIGAINPVRSSGGGETAHAYIA